MSVVSPARARRRRQQGPGLVGDPRRVGLDVDLVDHLPAPRAVLPAGGRVRAALRLAVADRRRHDPGPALPDALVDAVALAGHEPLGGVPDLVHRLGDVGAVLGHRRRRPHEHVALGRRATRRAGRSRSRSPTSRRPPARPGTRPDAARDTRALDAAIAAACGAGRADRRVGQVGHGVEAPARPDEGADADARRLVLAEVLDVTVARRHRLVAAVHHPGVGVHRAGVERRLHRRRRGVELTHGRRTYDSPIRVLRASECFVRAAPQRNTPMDGQRNGDREAALGERAHRVLGVVEAEVRVQRAALLAPRQRGGRRDAVHDLQDPAVVDAVLGPRAREVLDAADLDRRDRRRRRGARGGGGCGPAV